MTASLEILSSLGLLPNTETISAGTILDSNNISVNYRIDIGWDIAAANACDLSWRAYRIKLAEFLDSNYNSSEITDVLRSIPTEDLHWCWERKSKAFYSDEYSWFFFHTDNEVEAVCLTYHPKSSELTGDNIFYIEYIAIAPWNRDDPLAPKKYKGIGSLLIKEVLKYFKNNQSYDFGFSLHSLPQAVGFYEYIGMQHISNADKDSLLYFEMPNEKAADFIGQTI